MILIHDDKFPVFSGFSPAWSTSAAPPAAVYVPPTRYAYNTVVTPQGAAKIVASASGAQRVVASDS